MERHVKLNLKSSISVFVNQFQSETKSVHIPEFPKQVLTVKNVFFSEFSLVFGGFQQKIIKIHVELDLTICP